MDHTTPTPTVLADSSRARRTAGWLSWAGLVMLAAGVLLGLLSIAMAFPAINFAGFTSARTLTVPSATERTLAPDTYVIFQAVSPQDSFTTLGPEHVTVVGADGPVPVSPMTSTETVTLGESEYLGALRFDIQTAGTYTITIDPAARTEVIIMPSLTTTFVGIAGWIVLGVISWVVFYVGAVVLVVGLVWRSTAPMLARSSAQSREVRAQLAADAQFPLVARQEPTTPAQDQRQVPVPPAPVPPAPAPPDPLPAQVAPPAPAGWYVDPGQPDRWRYWDGTQWTAHHS